MAKETRRNQFHWHDTTVSVWTEIVNDRGIYDHLLNVLRKNGFRISQDKSVNKIIRRDHHAGERGDLKLVASHYPMGCKVEFHQELVTVNPHGGKYDFDREAKMPYLIRKRFHYERRCLTSALEARGYLDTTKPVHTDPWLYVEQRRQELRNFQGQCFYDSPPASYNSTDADGRTLKDGDVRWFYSNNRLQRGVALHNINNMWWVVSGGRVHNQACFHLFTYDPDKHSFRKPENPARRIEDKLKQAVAAQDFERAIGLRDALKRLNTTTV